MLCFGKGGGWSGLSLPLLPFDMNMYVLTIIFIVEDGSISHFEKENKQNVDPINTS